MTFEDKRRFLELYHEISLDIIVLTQEIANLRDDMLPSGQKLSDMPKSHSQRDLLADFAVRLDHLERERLFLMKSMLNINDSIDNLGETEFRFVLKQYYVQEGYTWGKIAQILCMSERNARRIGNKAIHSLKIKDLKNAKRLLGKYQKKDG